MTGGENMILKWLGLLMVLHMAPILAAEPDYAREERLAEQIVDAILDGDAEWLQANNREFLSIFTESDNEKFAVILMHGRGFHPDWADAINPLRVGLAENGFATLSLQMPVLEKEAKYYDYVPIFPLSHARIEAGIEFLRKRGFENITLIAHSCGAHMAMSWLREKGDQGIDAFIGLGLGATDYQQPMLKPFPLEQLKVPVLDLYGANEFPAVIKMAPDRQRAINFAGHASSLQQVLPVSDHYFTDQGDALLKATLDWLQTLELQ
jgi:pimeloyl-ACP methyl ester carboxylesterase